MTIYTALYILLSLMALASLIAGSAREFCAMETKWGPPPAPEMTNELANANNYSGRRA